MNRETACNLLDITISDYSNDPVLLKRALSDTVRDITSGKESKIQKNNTPNLSEFTYFDENFFSEEQDLKENEEN
jgi:hypothetical protein